MYFAKNDTRISMLPSESELVFASGQDAVGSGPPISSNARKSVSGFQNTIEKVTKSVGRSRERERDTAVCVCFVCDSDGVRRWLLQEAKVGESHEVAKGVGCGGGGERAGAREDERGERAEERRVHQLEARDGERLRERRALEHVAPKVVQVRHAEEERRAEYRRPPRAPRLTEQKRTRETAFYSHSKFQSVHLARVFKV